LEIETKLVLLWVIFCKGALKFFLSAFKGHVLFKVPLRKDPGRQADSCFAQLLFDSYACPGVATPTPTYIYYICIHIYMAKEWELQLL
jgi:hypothetical protein